MYETNVSQMTQEKRSVSMTFESPQKLTYMFVFTSKAFGILTTLSVGIIEAVSDYML